MQQWPSELPNGCQ